MRIIRERAAAVLVDVQERLFPHIHEKDAMESRLLLLLEGLRLLDIPLIVTQQYTRGLGPTIPSIRRALGWTGGSERDAAPSGGRDDPPPFIEKIAFSCWDEPAFRPALERLSRPRVLLAGIESHVCMLQTAIDLKEAGFTPVVIEDCTSSRRAGDKRIALQRLQGEAILLSTCESILFELTREAGTETFRAISRLLK